METGHSTIFTMHAGTSINCINRLVTKYLVAMPTLSVNIAERIIGSAIDYIIIQDNVPGIGRKITEIAEVDYDFATQTVRLTTIMIFDFIENDFKLINKIHPDKANLMMRRGITYEEIKPWIRDI